MPFGMAFAGTLFYFRGSRERLEWRLLNAIGIVETGGQLNVLLAVMTETGKLVDVASFSFIDEVSTSVIL